MPGFAHLHTFSGFSLRYGASHPERLAERASERGVDALALTDRDTLAWLRPGGKAAAVFAGRVVNQADNAQRLLTSKHPAIHHGLGMTCVWRHETAACREEREAAGLEANGPDEQLCRTTCTNLAYTDRDIESKKPECARWEAAAADRLSPKPLRDRAAAKAAPMRAVIAEHEQGRRASGGEEPMEVQADGAQTT